ncbi:MAG: repair protein RecO protein [Parcubacteria group bacterium GW2011_GWC1_35_8]|uniref:DNA repair protein RecO n=3 Tax=Candidatus Nomuraibacteriota TaxID=1752729 RepID=A0A1F6YRK0_9BACT|nr:MAG: repair protein RecO protein [Parcubacteria group bacterium GW2011_GWC1_35_8]KKP88279.1 MAG: repair protein RecO protein [Candidatus Nomurabacteria bacterium GW2011_GWC2_35_8]OGJ05518.1 MAG: DNA repair protein RecO [Candidatus Nomurabacteria bacterium RIFOXYA2_FULL_35_9]OGJ05565.1 MAG: DNA repair protein RecO [Candidatus Nomurabacteria bacterium RIFOXYA1_FULL_35_17]OGJ08910.1 MAG: DNA repair protein RecO [Candidatus Nomurabacteria bacterium RIFOXYC2_FULL_36_19]OGJ14471.1 MAG: DNA repair
MHHIYHTEGIILSSRSYGEAGKHFHIFTRDLGMITASAQGVRKMSSKLRFVLQDFAYLKIDLVQGKNIFRLTNASKTNKLEHIVKNVETLKVFANIARLLKRLLAGVEPNEILFADLLNGLAILERVQAKESLLNIEAILVLRILNNLGYIGENEVLQNLIKSPFEENLVFEVSKDRAKVLHQINKALKETHL